MTTVAVVGATGQVGRVMRSILEERNFPADKVRFFASSRSAGTELEFRGEQITVEDLAEVTEQSVADVDIAGLRYFRMARGRIAGVPVDISRTGYTGDLGYEIWVARGRAIEAPHVDGC